MLGLEYALALALTELDLDVARVLALMSWRPAAIAGVADRHGGAVTEGAAANLCVFDPDATWTIDGSGGASRSSNVPYVGRTVRGRVRHTFLRGEPVVLDGVAQR
jgi:dihydroorotase